MWKVIFLILGFASLCAVAFLCLSKVLRKVLTLLYLQNIPFHTLYVKNVSRLTRGIGCDLRLRLCRQLQSLSLYYHGRTNVGKLHTKAIRDIEMVESVPRMLVETIFQFLFGAGIAIIAIAKPAL